MPGDSDLIGLGQTLGTGLKISLGVPNILLELKPLGNPRDEADLNSGGFAEKILLRGLN